jgi:hypothetical protein
MINIFFSFRNFISAFKLSPADFLILATSTSLLLNQKIIFFLLKSYFELKNIVNIPHAGS